MAGKTLGMNPRPGGMNARPAPAQAPQAPQAFGRPGSQAPGSQRQMAPGPVRQPAQGSTVKAMPGQPLDNMRERAPAARQLDKAAFDAQKADAAAGLVEMLRNMTGGFAILSDEVLNNNLRLMTSGGMSYEDRTLSFECAEYVMANMAYMFMGLVLDPNFKKQFIDALNVELQIDDQPANVREQTRASMKDGKPFASKGSIVLGVTQFVPAIQDDLSRKMSEGFTKLDPYAAEFDAAVSAMSVEEKVQIGFIVSNFMYLIRAFSKNDMFMSYVVTVIEKVKATLAKA